MKATRILFRAKTQAIEVKHMINLFARAKPTEFGANGQKQRIHVTLMCKLNRVNRAKKKKTYSKTKKKNKFNKLFAAPRKEEAFKNESKWNSTRNYLPISVSKS